VAAREVLLYPDPRLKEVARPAQAAEVDPIATDLVDTMRSYERCVGIAAPQIGIASRVAVVDVTDHPKAETSSGLIVLANPHVVETRGAEVGREGCLSLPEVTANVSRPTAIVVEHLGGTLRCEGFEARCVLHELDHLDGILFLDRVVSLVDDVFRRRSYAPPASPRDESGRERSKSAGSEPPDPDRTG
jgi:peptide deformylase